MNSPVTVRINLRQLPPITDSLGAHIAAKLARFGSDERTLTEEPCDMMYLWALQFSGGSAPSIPACPSLDFDLTIVKVSHREEAKIFLASLH